MPQTSHQKPARVETTRWNSVTTTKCPRISRIRSSPMPRLAQLEKSKTRSKVAGALTDRPCNFTQDSSIRNSPCYHFLTMAVNPELLKILVCPLCKATLLLTDGDQGLKCTKCNR